MVRRNIRAVALGLLLALVATGASAQSGCGGQAAAGRVCGNATAAQGLPSLVTLTSLLDRAFGATQGNLLFRNSGGWAALPNPSIGANGGTGGSISFNGSSSGSVNLRVPAAAGNTTFQLPPTNGTSGYVLSTDGSGNTSWINNSAGGTVQSVGLAMPGIFTVSGSPVTLTGTLTATLATQAANLVWAGPTTGAASAPTFRSLVGADLPNPSASTLGGVQSYAAVGSQWINQISTSGVPSSSQPNFTDIAGTVSAAQCPTPGASSLGCIQSFALQASKWISSISTSGVPSATQPLFSDISGSISSSQLPSIGGATILANITGGTAVPTGVSASNVLDLIGSTQGQVLYRGASGWTILSPGTVGYVLTTGGPAANPSWTNPTTGGTVTSLTSGTGITVTGSPCTTACVINLAAVADQRIMANVSGGSAAPIANTLSSVLDILSSTTGATLYRAAGGTGWQALAAGSVGQVLTMGATTPSWTNVGSVSNVTITAGTGVTTSGTCTITNTGTCTVTNSGVVTVKKQVFTSSGTYTPSAGMIYALMECVGGGGGGGGVTGASSFSIGAGGGGAGGYSRVVVTAAAVGASKTVTIGALGGGGSAGSSGGTGGASSVGTLCVSNGGIGGGAGSSGGGTGGGAGGASGTGDLIVGGGAGTNGNYIQSNSFSAIGYGGNGSSSYFGGGGIGGIGGGGASGGGAASAYGAGGGGAGTNVASNASGGNGAAGVVFITEYNSQ